MNTPLRIAINGFGRIGRTVTRQILQTAARGDVEIVLINDIAPLETCAYLFRYDSTFGPYPGAVQARTRTLRVDDRLIPFHDSQRLSALDLSGVDVLIDCTGRAKDRRTAMAGLEAGAKAVLISGPADAADATIVMGANENALGPAQIVSIASCTTNAVAPLLKALDCDLGIARAHVTTVHCYTGSQPTVDMAAESPARSRAAAVSMVPTTTSAAHQVIRVLPEFHGRLSVSALRVPCLSVSAVDAVLQLTRAPSESIPDYLRRRFAGSGIIGLTDDPCVSTDLRARPESLILALPETEVIDGRQIRLFGWYDNEWGFSARLIEMARRMAARMTEGDTHHGTGRCQESRASVGA